MSQEGKKIVSAIFSRTSLTIVLFIMGIAAYVWGFCLDEGDNLRSILLKIGDVLVIGVVIGFISNAAQFLKVYKKELQDVVYGKTFVGNLKDVSDIWESISKHMFLYKFPKIHQDFLEAMKSYFPKDEVSYYNEYEVHIKIDWHDSCANLIKVTETVHFDLIAESESKIVYPLKTWTHVIEGKTYENRITSFTVNQMSPKKEFPVSETIDDGNRCEERKIELKGHKKYTLDYVREKVYDLTDDHYIGFRAKYIVKDLRVCLECPENIDAQFICRGTQKDFEDVIKASSKNKIEKKYKGIILPRQGYIFALQKK